VEGEAGSFSVVVSRKPRYIKGEKCTGCGVCAAYCPVNIPDTYNKGIGKTKCVFIPYAQAVPATYSVDPEHCLFLTRNECRQCEQACGSLAFNFKEEEEKRHLDVGSIILAPGFEEFDPRRKPEYGYGRLPNVVTSTEFERMTSASGPFLGHIERPSDGETPQRIAFLQCVGSRDVSISQPYCSSVCCMFAIKEAVVALEHEPELKITLFYMDIRTQGKGFEEYYERAKSKGIGFVRSKASSIKRAHQSDNLMLCYAAEDGTYKEEEFDLVVLSIGLCAPSQAKSLAKTMGIKLNEYNFCRAREFAPLETNRDGIYVAGTFQGPKDIPETVMQASGAAAIASGILSPARGSLVEKRQYVPELPWDDSERRIGVFVCHCGINIAGVVDVGQVEEYAEGLDDVVYVEKNLYSCSQDNQARIRDLIKEHRLNRVVVAACSPRTHEPLFQETIREAGLNRCFFEMANIRDQCSWVHMDQKREATAKAKDLIRMAVAKARALEPLPEATVKTLPKGLVIGGGISGMTAALKLAHQGFDCFLVEKEEELGGNLRYVHHTLGEESPQFLLRRTIKEVESNEKIKVFKRAEVKAVDGYIGNFTTTLSVTEGSRVREGVIEHGIVVVATGAQELKPDEYLYGQDERVVTQLEMEERIAKDGDALKELKQVVMIQCVGSRCEERPYCSKLCCTKAIKNALKLKEMNPRCEVMILYRDIRAYGFKEDYYSRARDEGVLFIRYDVDEKPKVSVEEGALTIATGDPVLGEEITIKPDVLVLSSAIVPNENEDLPRLLKLPVGQDGFFMEAHAKLRPVDFSVDGVFLCGLAHYPKPIDESIAQASAAAGRAAIPLARGYVDVEPIVSSVDDEKCFGCGICEYLCPFKAIRVGSTEGGDRAETISALCKGCGVCAAHCPRSAISMGRFTTEQILSQIVAFGGG
jgi:heterodisulfide reductase subunit A